MHLSTSLINYTHIYAIQRYTSLKQGKVKQNYDKILFPGQLEDEFFQSVKNGDEPNAAKSLNKINFDIPEKDSENGNNVFSLYFTG